MKFLCGNNPLYIACGIKIDESHCSKLPINGIPSEFNELIDEEFNNNETMNDDTNLDNGPEIEDIDEPDIEVVYIIIII